MKTEDPLDDIFDENTISEEEKKELGEPVDDRKPCPHCGKNLKWLADGSRPRQHKCEPKTKPQPEQLKQEQEPFAPPTQEKPKITVDMVVEKYVETRDEIAKIKKAADEKMAALEEVQERRENWLKAQLDANGVESMRTSHGTCFINWKDSATVADRELFLEWVRTEGQWDFLENRVSKTAVKQRLADGETTPPGVNYVKIKDVKIRRA